MRNHCARAASENENAKNILNSTIKIRYKKQDVANTNKQRPNASANVESLKRAVSAEDP